METKRNSDGTYTVSGVLKYTDPRTARTYDYNEQMKEDLLKQIEKKTEKGMPLLGELDHYDGEIPYFGGQTANRGESTSSDVLSLAKISHEWKNPRINESGELEVDVRPILGKSRVRLQGDVLQSLLDAGCKFRPMVRAIAHFDEDEVKITDIVSIDLVSTPDDNEEWHTGKSRKDEDEKE